MKPPQSPSNSPGVSRLTMPAKQQQPPEMTFGGRGRLGPSSASWDGCGAKKLLEGFGIPSVVAPRLDLVTSRFHRAVFSQEHLEHTHTHTRRGAGLGVWRGPLRVFPPGLWGGVCFRGTSGHQSGSASGVGFLVLVVEAGAQPCSPGRVHTRPASLAMLWNRPRCCSSSEGEPYSRISPLSRTITLQGRRRHEGQPRAVRISTLHKNCYHCFSWLPHLHPQMPQPVLSCS